MGDKFGMGDRRDAADGDGWVQRVDRGTILSRSMRPDGTLLISGVAARAGVLTYRNADGTTTRELVPEQTLYDANATLGRAPLTLQHPSVDVTPENVADLGVGDVDSQIDMADGYVQVRVAVRRKDAIEAVRSGRTVELSPGYRVQLDPTPGVDPVHGPYDAIQRRRVVNHLALVDRARGGPTVRLRTDAAEATEPLRADPALNPAGTPARGARMLSVLMQCLALLGRADRYDSEEVAGATLADAIRADQAKRDKVEADLRAELGTATAARNDHKTRADAAERERDTQKARADAAEATLATLRTEAKTRADAEERSGLGDLCARYRVDATQDLPKVKRAIAAAFLGTEVRADQSDAYVDGVVAAARRDHAEGTAAGERAWRDEPAPRNDSTNRKARPSAHERWMAAQGLGPKDAP